MKLWKKKRAVALGLALMLALPGCQEPDGEEGIQKETEASGPLQEAVSMDPTHIFEEVREDLLIDAEISGPPAGVVPKVYEGHYKVFSREEIDAFLGVIGDGVASIDVDQVTDQEHMYGGTCTSGATFSQVYDKTGENPNAIFSYSKKDSRRYFEYPIYINQGDYDGNSERRLAYLFEKEEDFPFATAREAEEAVRAALAALGLEDLVLNRTLYLGHNQLIQAGEVLQSEGWGSSVGKGGAAYSLVDDWSEQDDCYMFEFFTSIDGVPMTYHSWKKETVSYCGNGVTVWYNAKGIVSLEVAFPWVSDEVAEEPKCILSAEEALEVARGKLIYVVTEQETVLNQVSLQYFYIQDKNRWLLRPVWEISVQRPSMWGDGYVLDYVLVDAVTGEEI